MTRVGVLVLLCLAGAVSPLCAQTMLPTVAAAPRTSVAGPGHGREARGAKPTSPVSGATRVVAGGSKATGAVGGPRSAATPLPGGGKAVVRGPVVPSAGTAVRAPVGVKAPVLGAGVVGSRSGSPAMPSAPDSALAGLRWSYPRGDRVDPVVPPDALYSGEGFPQLQLSVIMYQEGRRAGSQALVTLDGADPIRRVVREGDKVGNYEILRIERDRVVVGVRTLGAVHREVLLPFGADSADARNKKP